MLILFFTKSCMFSWPSIGDPIQDDASRYSMQDGASFTFLHCLRTLRQYKRLHSGWRLLHYFHTSHDLHRLLHPGWRFPQKDKDKREVATKDGISWIQRGKNNLYTINSFHTTTVSQIHFFNYHFCKKSHALHSLPVLSDAPLIFSACPIQLKRSLHLNVINSIFLTQEQYI